jgi:hypothetical protein
MPNALTREWNALKSGSAGHRFQSRYVAAQKSRKNASGVKHVLRVVRWLVAIVAIAIGVVLVFIPGPAILFFFIAGGILASESKLIARFLDWMELKIRSFSKWGVRTWKGLSLVAKAAIVAIALAIAAGAAFGCYQLVMK